MTMTKSSRRSDRRNKNRNRNRNTTSYMSSEDMRQALLGTSTVVHCMYKKTHVQPSHPLLLWTVRHNWQKLFPTGKNFNVSRVVGAVGGDRTRDRSNVFGTNDSGLTIRNSTVLSIDLLRDEEREWERERERERKRERIIDMVTNAVKITVTNTVT